MDWVNAFLVILVGLVSGYINTLAGAGSLLTLPLLIFLGLPATIANGTNRVGILIQSIVATFSFKKQEIFEWGDGLYLGLPSVAGAVFGAFMAVRLDEFLMKRIIGFLLLFMLLLVFFKPDVWIKGHASGQSKKSLWHLPVYFVIGFYGGFIQAGVGYFLLAGLVLVSGYNLVKANGLKVFIVLLFTIPALTIFVFNQQVNLLYGLLLGAGSSAGAYIGAKSAKKFGAKYVMYIVALTLVVSIFDFLGIIKIALSWFN